MKIKEFMEEYKKNSKNPTFNLSKLLEVKTYIPILRKRQLAEIVYENSIGMVDGLIQVDSLTKYLIFTMLMISEYTCLEFTVDENGQATADAIIEYDMLCETGLIDVIIGCFAADYARANEILNFVFKDKLSTVNTVEAIVGGLAQKINKTLDTLGETLKNKIEEFDFDMSNLDVEQIENFVNLLGSTSK